MSDIKNGNNEEIELIARLFTNDLKEYVKLTGSLEELTANNVYGVLRKKGYTFDFMYLHKEASFIFGYECTKPYKREFVPLLLNETGLDHDYILRRLNITNINVKKWSDNQVENYIEKATKQFDAIGLPISEELKDFIIKMNDLIAKEDEYGE